MPAQIIDGDALAARMLDALIAYPENAAIRGLCCTNPVRDSSRESSVVAGAHEQSHTPRLQDQELARP